MEIRLKITRATAAVVIVAIVLLVGSGLYLFGWAPGTPKSSSQSSSVSFQGENETVIATYASSFTEWGTSSTSSTTVSSTGFFTSPGGATTTSTTMSAPAGGTFSYTPISDLKILAVSATASVGTGGNRTLQFSATYQNAGNGTIYVISGGGSSLDAKITSGPATTETRGGPVCEIASAIIPVGPGESHTSITPGCWSRYLYVLMSPGTIQISMTLGWSKGTGSSAISESTDIVAQFTF